jgi:hypothetical protein
MIENEQTLLETRQVCLVLALAQEITTVVKMGFP